GGEGETETSVRRPHRGVNLTGRSPRGRMAVGCEARLGRPSSRGGLPGRAAGGTAVSVNVRVSTLSSEGARPGVRGEEVYLDDLPSAGTLDLERDWDALHSLLTGSTATGRGPLAFLKTGGHDVNRGANQRLFRPAGVLRIHIALLALPMAVCRRRYKE